MILTKLVDFAPRLYCHHNRNIVRSIDCIAAAAAVVVVVLIIIPTMPRKKTLTGESAFLTTNRCAWGRRPLESVPRRLPSLPAFQIGRKRPTTASASRRSPTWSTTRMSPTLKWRSMPVTRAPALFLLTSVQLRSKKPIVLQEA